MKKINNYFFGEDEIAVSDGLWFYGSSAAIVAIVIFTAAVRFFG